MSADNHLNIYIYRRVVFQDQPSKEAGPRPGNLQKKKCPIFRDPPDVTNSMNMPTACPSQNQLNPTDSLHGQPQDKQPPKMQSETGCPHEQSEARVKLHHL